VARAAAGDCIVGPSWLPDGEREAGSPAKVRPIAEIELAPPPRNGMPDQVCMRAAWPHSAAKRALDLVLSSLVLAAFAPLLALIALLIMVDDGRPVLFAHLRQRRGGRNFRCWKFRTMCRNAAAMTRTLQSRNVCDGPQFYIADDPRVTRVGRVLRRWHLDELPQFWNVLMGHMSIVGPLPSPDDENQFCPAWRDLRLSVRPGITGLWQLKRTRRPGTDFQEWIRYDIEYVRRATPWLDLAICVRTVTDTLMRRSRNACE
jgi:lipopolysaccharide/colanic/teichoic acid biosynthesis glycosyltransferase